MAISKNQCIRSYRSAVTALFNSLPLLVVCCDVLGNVKTVLLSVRIGALLVSFTVITSNALRTKMNGSRRNQVCQSIGFFHLRSLKMLMLRIVSRRSGFLYRSER